MKYIPRFKISHANMAFDEEAFVFFKAYGFVLLENFIEPDHVIEIGNLIDKISKCEALRGVAHNYGPSLQRVWNLINKGTVFHELLLSPQIDLWMNRIFDRDTSHRKYFLSSFQANILYPGATAQILHTDTPVPDPIPPYPLKANTIWLLDDLTDDNGATEVIPGSHLRGRRPSRNPTPDDLSEITKVTAPKGSLLVTHGALWHRSGSNKSAARRRVLLGSFCASYLREISSEEDMARVLWPSVNEIIDPVLYDMIGGNHGLKPGYKQATLKSKEGI
jgi:hypothetical protein